MFKIMSSPHENQVIDIFLYRQVGHGGLTYPFVPLPSPTHCYHKGCGKLARKP